MEKVQIFIHMVCTSHPNLLQSIWCFTMNHRQFRTSTDFWNTSRLLNLSHSAVNELSPTACTTLKNNQRSYRETSAMACLKGMGESSQQKLLLFPKLFFPKIYCFFFFLSNCFDWKQYGKKGMKKRRTKHFSDTLSESTQIQLAFKHYFTYIATSNKPHTLITFFKKHNSFYIVMIVC